MPASMSSVVRIERKVNWLFFAGSVAILVSGILLLIWPPHGTDTFMRMASGAAPILAVVSITVGAVGVWRLVTLAFQRTAMLAADSSGISVEGGPPIPWDQVLEIEPFEWKQRITTRGILIKLRDRSLLTQAQLGSIWTRLAQRNTPGDIFISDAIIKTPLLNAIAELHGARPR